MSDAIDEMISFGSVVIDWSACFMLFPAISGGVLTVRSATGRCTNARPPPPRRSHTHPDPRTFLARTSAAHTHCHPASAIPAPRSHNINFTSALVVHSCA